jgi:hypothetical protein
MMVIGANTPAMIKTMTAEVESKNLIVASMHYARKAPTWHVPAPAGSLHLPELTRLAITRSTSSLATLVITDWHQQSARKKPPRPPPAKSPLPPSLPSRQVSLGVSRDAVPTIHSR